MGDKFTLAEWLFFIYIYIKVSSKLKKKFLKYYVLENVVAKEKLLKD